MDNNRNARTALDWAPEGKRQRGRPKETWRGTSGFPFLLVIDWILRKTTSSSNTGIRWNFTSKLEDLYYADDIALLAQQTRCRERAINTYAKSTGLKINAAKTNQWDEHKQQPTHRNRWYNDAKHFIYLGATVQDRSKWRELVHGTILHEETGN